MKPLSDLYAQFTAFDENRAQDSLNGWSTEKLQGLTPVGYLVEGKRDYANERQPIDACVARLIEASCVAREGIGCDAGDDRHFASHAETCPACIIEDAINSLRSALEKK